MTPILDKIRPMFTSIVTTAEVNEEPVYSETGIITIPAGTLKDIQKVISVGPNVRNFKAGELVHINPRLHFKGLKTNMTPNAVAASQFMPEMAGQEGNACYDLPTKEVGGQEVLILDEMDVDYVVEEMHEVDYSKKAEKTDIIIPAKPKIII